MRASRTGITAVRIMFSPNPKRCWRGRTEPQRQTPAPGSGAGLTRPEDCCCAAPWGRAHDARGRAISIKRASVGGSRRKARGAALRSADRIKAAWQARGHPDHPALFWFRLSRSNDAASGFSTLSQGAGQRSEVSFRTLALPHFQNTGEAGFSLVGIKPEPGPPFSHT